MATDWCPARMVRCRNHPIPASPTITVWLDLAKTVFQAQMLSLIVVQVLREMAAPCG